MDRFPGKTVIAQSVVDQEKLAAVSCLFMKLDASELRRGEELSTVTLLAHSDGHRLRPLNRQIGS
jgi:hypothetical protein